MVQKNCSIRPTERNPPIRKNACRLHGHPAVIAAIGVVFLVVHQGCAHKAPDVAPLLSGRTALIVRTPTGKEPLEGLGRERSTQVGWGAAAGAGLGAYGASCGIAGIVCVPALAIVGAIGGAALGAATYDSHPMWKETELALRVALAELELNQALAKVTVAYAQANAHNIHVPPSGIGLEAKDAVPREALAREGFGALLEISDTSVVLVPAELTAKPMRQFLIRANVRLIRTDDNSVLVERTVSSDLGPPRPIGEWLADDARVFREAVPPALQKLAEDIVAESFLLHRFSAQIVRRPMPMFDAHVNGLLPVYPALMAGRSSHQLSEGDALRPTLKWGPFNAGAVTYDLRIWGSNDTGMGHAIGEVVYSRERLVDTWHTLDAPLEPSSNYFWSVRAHFVQDGKGRVTEWSRYSLKPIKVTNILTMGTASAVSMLDLFYQFRTPPTPRKE